MDLTGYGSGAGLMERLQRQALGGATDGVLDVRVEQIEDQTDDAWRQLLAQARREGEGAWSRRRAV